MIEPRIPACDRLQAVVTRDDGVSSPPNAGPKAAAVTLAEPFKTQGSSLKTSDERTKHVRSMLTELQSVATSAMRELEDSDSTTRDAIVVRLSTQIEHASKELLSVGDQLSTPNRSAFRAMSNAAADAVLEVHAWIGSRRPNAVMRIAILPATTHLDEALVQLGVASIEQRPTPRPTSGEADEARKEEAQAYVQTTNLADAITAELLSRHADATHR